MLRRLTAIGVFVLVLAPSAYLAWSLRDMPHLGFYHDDSIYWVSAKSLASGDGYRISSLPGQPFQTKYPPLYAMLLAGIWRINPNFPNNLPLATLFAWVLLPLYLLSVWIFLRQCEFDWRVQCVLFLIAGLSPVAVVFSFSLMPELLFTAFLLGSVTLAQRASEPGAARWLPALAGLAGALAYLTKSSAAPLLVTVPLCFALRKQFAKAALYIAAMLPAVVGWQWWVSGHLSRSWDLVTLYYTNYLGFQIYNVSLRDLPLVMWHNLDGFLMGAGKLLTFDVPYGSKHLERVVAVAAIAGCVRLARRTHKLQYPVAALGFTLALLVWHYTPDQRFVFPLYPLLLAGLWTELANVCQALQISWRKPAVADRLAAMVGAGALGAFALFLAFTTTFGLFQFLPELFSTYRADFASRRPAYQWLAHNAPRDANVFAYDDPLLYLYAGRKSCSLPIPPKLYYHDDQAGIDKLIFALSDFAAEQRLGYVVIARDDFYRDLHERGAKSLKQAVESNSAFEQVFRNGDVAVYRLSGRESHISLGAGL
ncbi:MAG TPA: hypothetical protein VH157_05005 [Bryobacteraceae bacterium]|nr:hypothetical protein [Bryobacteraceae bacterium]